jgi:hypothetical protein
VPLLLVVSFMVLAALAAPRVLAGFDLIDNALVPRVLSIKPLLFTAPLGLIDNALRLAPPPAWRQLARGSDPPAPRLRPGPSAAQAGRQHTDLTRRISCAQYPFHTLIFL